MEGIRQGDIPGVQLRRRHLIPDRSPEEVWPYLVEARRIEQWLADRVSLEAGPPLVLRLETGELGEPLRREYAEVVFQAEPSRLVFGFRELDSGWTAATSLTIELSRRGQGCEVMVLQEGFQKLPLSNCMTVWERSRTRWARALESLGEVAGLLARPG